MAELSVAFICTDSQADWNSSEWRCAIPCRALRAVGVDANLVWVEDFVHDTKISEDACERADIIFIQRNLFGWVVGAVFKWQAKGKKIVVDFDDAYHFMPEHYRSYNFWHRSTYTDGNGKLHPLGFDPLFDIQTMAPHVDAITSPSYNLLNYWSQFNKNLYWFPNLYDPDAMIVRNKLKKPASKIIGWGGGDSHFDSWRNSNIVPAIINICVDDPEVKMMLCGGSPQICLLFAGISSQLIIHPWMPVRDWASYIDLFDVGVAPLAGLYDDARSWIKVLELMVMKKPWVTSDRVPYRPLAQYGSMVDDSVKGWEAAIRDALYHPDQDKVEKGYEFALNMSVTANTDRLISTFMAIKEDRHKSDKTDWRTTWHL